MFADEPELASEWEHDVRGEGQLNGLRMSGHL